MSVSDDGEDAVTGSFSMICSSCPLGHLPATALLFLPEFALRAPLTHTGANGHVPSGWAGGVPGTRDTDSKASPDPKKQDIAKNVLEEKRVK